MKTKLVKDKEYYVMVGGHWYPEYAIVCARYIGSAGYSGNADLVVMQQRFAGIEHAFEVELRHIYPKDPGILKAVLHNESQQRLIICHAKTFDMTTAYERITGWINELAEHQRHDMIALFRHHRPELVSPKGQLLKSKFKIKDWNELNKLFLHTKYPMVDIPKIGKAGE